ncbi:MAG: class I SAM-dependent methyltransferase [Paludibacter sp.]|nr:class I SAM-dependent methyltransferase [Paludibacter sp.]
MQKDNFAHKAAEWDTPSKKGMTDKFVKEMMLQITIHPQWKGLEIGAGTGLVGLQIAPYLKNIVFEDTSEAMLEVLKSKLGKDSPHEILHAEIFEYTKQDIDFVFSCMAFHHLPDIDKALKHINKIITKDAIIVVGDILTEDGSFHRFEPIHHKGFDLSKLMHQFIDAGFEILTAHSYNTLTRERTPGVFTDYEQFILVAKKI